MLIFSFILLVFVIIRIGFHALMSKKRISFLILCSATVLYSPPPSETHNFSSCPFKAPPPEYPVWYDWSAHTHLSQHL